MLLIQRDKLNASVPIQVEDKCPPDYDGEMRWLWRKYSVGGMYTE